MTTPENSGPSRREMLKTAGQVAAASALAGVALPNVHAQGGDAIQVALVGCGGRGTGAATEALASPNGPTRLVAMADVMQNRLNSSYSQINRRQQQRVAVPENQRFIGFDGYKHAMDALKPGDIVILATPPAFRWVHFTYAIQKRLHVFMEKPVAVDGPTVRRMLALADAADKQNIRVAVGLMCRHCVARRELFDRLRQGEIGDITLLRAYRMAGPTASAFSGPKPDGISELLYQIQRFHSFLWASGGAFSDFLIHNIDECCWMKDAWPVSAKGSGGRHYRGDYIDQNFDSYTVEYTFGDGSKLELQGRCMTGCWQQFASHCHGTKGSAHISGPGHTPALCRIYKGQQVGLDRPNAADIAWRFTAQEPDPYQIEWDHFLEAIHQNRPYNEVRRGAEASLITAMGRMACHTGQIITRDQMLNHEHELAPHVDQLSFETPAPLRLGKDNKYPVPQPGIVRNREYREATP
jgi:predicted dehydrogenase